jgi:hypothetical protein
MNRRRFLKTILLDPSLRRELMVQVIIAIQDREDITTTKIQAEHAYDKARKETYAT